MRQGDSQASRACWKYRPVKGRVVYFNTNAHGPDCLSAVHPGLCRGGPQYLGQVLVCSSPPPSLSLSLSLSLSVPPPPSPSYSYARHSKPTSASNQVSNLRYGSIYEVERHTTGDSLVPGGTDTNDGVSVQRTNMRMVYARFNYSVNIFYDTVIILFQIL